MTWTINATFQAPILKEMTQTEESERKYLLAQFKGRQSLIRTGTASECISEPTLQIKDKFESNAIMGKINFWNGNSNSNKLLSY